MMKLVGLTGSIGTGKTTVSRLIEKNGYHVIDCDEVARCIVEPGKPALQQLIKTFGNDILLPNGELDRPKLGDMVFKDAAKRKKLNSITHRYIFIELAKRIFSHFWSGTSILFLDAPLLFEAGLHRISSCVVVVFCDSETQLQRVMTRDGFEKEEAQRRIDSQMSLKEKCERADFTIDNSRTLHETEQQVTSLLQRLSEQYAGGRPPAEQNSYVGKLLVLAISSLSLCLLFYSFHALLSTSSSSTSPP